MLHPNEIRLVRLGDTQVIPTAAYEPLLAEAQNNDLWGRVLPHDRFEAVGHVEALQHQVARQRTELITPVMPRTVEQMATALAGGRPVMLFSEEVSA